MYVDINVYGLGLKGYFILKNSSSHLVPTFSLNRQAYYRSQTARRNFINQRKNKNFTCQKRQRQVTRLISLGCRLME